MDTNLFEELKESVVKELKSECMIWSLPDQDGFVVGDMIKVKYLDLDQTVRIIYLRMVNGEHRALMLKESFDRYLTGHEDVVEIVALIKAFREAIIRTEEHICDIWQGFDAIYKK